MKKFFIYFVALTAFSAFLTSCSKDNDIQNEMEQIEEVAFFFSCTLDGVVFESKGDLTSYGINDTDDGDVFAYGVQNNFDDVMYIKLPKAMGDGTHVISEEVFGLLSINEIAYGTYWGEHTGQITITSESENVITGNFDFLLYNADDTSDVVKVENGKFRVKFRD